MAIKYLNSIDLNKNELQNARVQNLAAAPVSPVAGQIYYDTASNAAYIWNVTAWIPTDATKATNIPNTALATNPLARANHTGTQLSTTISDLATTVKAYTLDSFAVPVANISMNSYKLTNLAAGTAGSNDAARMVDLDNAVNAAAAGIDSKPSVRLVSTSNIATLSGLTAVDGVTPVAGDRILLTAQTDGAANGVYVTSATAWSRALDANNTGEITPGAFWFVEEGTTYGKTQWRCNNTGTITLDTTSITIIQFGASAMYTGGAGLVLTGSDFSVGAGTGISVTADAVAIDTTVVARKYSVLIGDGTSTTITVTHNLNNQDVMGALRDVSTNNIVYADTANPTVNTTTFTFAIAPAANTYKAIIIG